ncbi:MAG: acyl-ACP--UDP-N-acetylglucosamine O-acyltransferase [Deltaproteobacteria bacterium]|jgi:UDP-N-acetylglucosamine acyltransferase
MADTNIHASSIVDPKAELGEGVTVGPFSIVGPHVKLGDGVKIHSHAVIDGHTTLGREVQVYPQAAVGLPPQDLKYDGSATTLEVGDRTVIRECATLQPGSIGEGCGETVVGSDCLIMAYCHVAHDCRIGNRVIMANATQVAGHCTIEDFVILGGVTTVHQFVRIGTRAFTGASTRVVMDIPPFTTADGHPARLVGLNRVGLERGGMPEPVRRAIKQAYRAIFMRGPYADALAEVEGTLAKEHEEVAYFCNFLRGSERGVTRGRKK